MFSFLKKKSKPQLLNEKYQKLLKEAYKMSTISRIQSDLKYSEADKVLKQIEALEQSSQ